jgi:[ribosomal protein S5]-alanine N-acetyltransferase
MKLDKDIFLTGDHIYLRLLAEKDIEGNYATWLNNSEITRYNSHGRYPMTVGKLKDYVKSVNTSDSMLVLAIIHKETNEHIGNIGLHNINWIDRSAELSVLLGEKDYWGKGLFSEAGKLMIDHGFKILNLHRIYSGIITENIGAIKAVEKMGMTREGTLKEAVFSNGKYVDDYLYGILSHQFKNI